MYPFQTNVLFYYAFRDPPYHLQLRQVLVDFLEIMKKSSPHKPK